MSHSRAIAVPLLVLLTALPAPVALAQAAPAVEQAAPAVAQTAPTPGPAGDSPATACYLAARRHDTEAYACDLAVQMAKSPAVGAATGETRAALAAALTNRGLVLAYDGRLEPALADLDAALALFPDDPELHGNRGNVLLRMGRLVDALNAHDRAVTLAPNDATGYFNRAFSYLALGNEAAAQQDVARTRALLNGEPSGLSPPPVPAGGAVPGR